MQSIRFEKKEQLLEDIIKGQFFGKVKASIHVIEFQKRGLPHMHLMIALEKSITDEIDVDKYIQAFIPDKEQDPILYNLVTKHMIHGPCGDLNKNSICMVEKRCSKNFPKQFQVQTTLTDDTYP